MILCKSGSARHLSNSGEKIKRFLFMDDLKLYDKNKRGVDSLVQTVWIFRDDICMEFGADKCAIFVLKRGKTSLTSRDTSK